MGQGSGFGEVGIFVEGCVECVFFSLNSWPFGGTAVERREEGGRGPSQGFGGAA